MANNFDVKDAAAASKTIKTTDTAGVHTSHHNIDVIAAGSNAIGKLAANSGVDIGDVDILSIAAGNNNIGDVDVASIAAGNNNIGDVDIASIAAGDNNIGNVDIVTLPGVVGTIADDATTPGNPVMIGGTARNFDGTDPGNTSAEDDVTRLVTDRQRRLYTNPSNPFFWRVNENNATAQTANPIKGAPGANLSLFVQTLVISCGAVAGSISIVEDTGGTPATLLGPYYFAINGGIALEFNPPLQVTANKDVGYTSVTMTTHTVSISGFTAPV